MYGHPYASKPVGPCAAPGEAMTGYSVRHGAAVAHLRSLEEVELLLRRLGTGAAAAVAGGDSLLSAVAPAAHELLTAVVRHFDLHGRAAESLGTALRVAAVRAAFGAQMLRDAGQLAGAADALRHLSGPRIERVLGFTRGLVASSAAAPSASPPASPSGTALCDEQGAEGSDEAPASESCGIVGAKTVPIGYLGSITKPVVGVSAHLEAREAAAAHSRAVAGRHVFDEADIAAGDVAPRSGPPVPVQPVSGAVVGVSSSSLVWADLSAGDADSALDHIEAELSCVSACASPVVPASAACSASATPQGKVMLASRVAAWPSRRRCRPSSAAPLAGVVDSPVGVAVDSNVGSCEASCA